jgi:hypothetical protein
MTTSHIAIIDRLIHHSRREDGENSRIGVTHIRPVPLPLNTVIEGKAEVFAVNAILHRRALASHRFYLVSAVDGEIAKVAEYSNAEARDADARVIA